MWWTETIPLWLNTSLIWICNKVQFSFEYVNSVILILINDSNFFYWYFSSTILMTNFYQLKHLCKKKKEAILINCSVIFFYGPYTLCCSLCNVLYLRLYASHNLTHGANFKIQISLEWKAISLSQQRSLLTVNFTIVCSAFVI